MREDFCDDRVPLAPLMFRIPAYARHDLAQFLGKRKDREESQHRVET